MELLDLMTSKIAPRLDYQINQRGNFVSETSIDGVVMSVEVKIEVEIEGVWVAWACSIGTPNSAPGTTNKRQLPTCQLKNCQLKNCYIIKKHIPK